MSSTTRALKRLGIGGVTVATVLAMPYVGATSAFAATPSGPATVQITSQLAGLASTKNDGTDTLVKISANVTVPGSGQTAVAGVRFSYTPITVATGLPAGPTVQLGVDTTAPYSATYTAADTTATTQYRETAEAVDSTGTVIGASQDFQDVDLKSTYSSVHISAPAEGASIGRTTQGNIVVSGTRSADLPALSITAQTRDNSDGSLSPAGAAATVNAGVVATPPNSNAWSVVLAVPACPAGAGSAGCNVVINATATGASGSDETTEAKLYDAVLTTFTVAPPSATKPVNSPQDFVVTAKDQNGAPLGGVPVTVVENPATAADETSTPAATNGGTATGSTTGASGTTGTDGLFTFRSVDATAETTNFKITSGTGNPAVDFTIGATLTTYVSTPKTPTLTLTPSKTLYATQCTGVNCSSTHNGSEYTASTPVVDVCITDQNGNGYPNTNPAPSNLVVTVTRVTKTGSTTSAPVTTTVAPGSLTADAATGKSNCYKIPHAAAGAEDSGSDTFKAYFENNGTPGYSTAAPSDVAATDVVANWGQLFVKGVDTQAVKGTNVTVNFTVLTPDGTPFVGRKLTLGGITGSGNFPTTQPGTTTRTNAGTAICTTTSEGVCAVTLTDPVAEDIDIYAYDNITDATLNQIGTGDYDFANVSFRNNSVALTHLTQTGAAILQPAVNTSAGKLRPGDVGQFTYNLRDANTGGAAPALANVSTTLTIDNGFFTPVCPSGYESCTFNPAPADGAVTGNLKSLGKTITVTSDDNGDVVFAIADGADPLFNANGTVPVVITAVANGGTAKTSDATSTAVPSFTTDGIKVANGGTVTLLPTSTTDKLSGDVQDYGTNLVPGQNGFTSKTGTNFVVHVTDQFGNLVKLASCDVNLAVTGGGYLGTSSSTVPPGTNSTTGSACGSFTGSNTPSFHLDSDSTSTSGESNTVTATWPAPVTVFKVVTSGTPPVTTITTISGTPATVNKTASFTVNLYAVDEHNLHYVFASTPGNTVPINTAVTTSVTVTDQKNAPVEGLCVQFLRSGPNDTAGNSQTGGTTPGCVFTNVQGKAGTSYSSGTAGTATITGIVKDTSGNELSRGVQNVTFTNGTPQPSGLSYTLGTQTIAAGQQTKLIITGAPNKVVEILVKGAASSNYTVLTALTRALNSAGGYAPIVNPSTTSSYIVRYQDGSGATASQQLLVKAVQSVTVAKRGTTGVFGGLVKPSVKDRPVTVYYYVNGGHVQTACSTFVKVGGHFGCEKTGFKAGQLIHVFAQTDADKYNAAGRSGLKDLQF